MRRERLLAPIWLMSRRCGPRPLVRSGQVGCDKKYSRAPTTLTINRAEYIFPWAAGPKLRACRLAAGWLAPSSPTPIRKAAATPCERRRASHASFKIWTPGRLGWNGARSNNARCYYRKWRTHAAVSMRRCPSCRPSSGTTSETHAPLSGQRCWSRRATA